jgi:hypothetical protein
MDLTPLRPSVRFVCGKARKQGCISRSKTRLSSWIAACKLGLAERSAAPRRLLTCPFAPLSCSLHRLFALLPAELAEDPDRPASRHIAEDNWFGQRSAIPTRSFRDLSSIMMFVDFALWPAFCSSSWQSEWTPWVWRATGIACVRGTNG